MEDIFNNKYEYLKYQMFNRYGITEKDDIYYLSIPLKEYDYSCKQIPECHSCIEDNNAIQSQLQVQSKTKNNVDVRIKCGQSCIWYKWFDNKRQQYAKKNNKKLEYYTKKEYTTIKIGNETINKIDFNEHMKLTNIN
jgi:hypothetical protein